MDVIPFNKPYTTGNEFRNIAEAIERGHLSGDGEFTQRCHQWLEQMTGCNKALLTHSGTAALEMAAILADIRPGDEVIMPSFTFVSTANAFVLRGGIPVFVDIRPDTLNIDEKELERAITERTKAIVVVHYAGVACVMDAILNIAFRHHLLVIEDAAHGVMAKYQNQPLGSFGQLAAVSFHETKNIIAGEGGALLVNDQALVERAEIIREKGTDRSRFFRGEVDKYTWVDIGSSYLPSEINAAFLWAQMQQGERITQQRLSLWTGYWQRLRQGEQQGLFRLPVIPVDCQHNAHMFYLLLPERNQRDALISYLKLRAVMAVFHYIPLHNSPAGKQYGRTPQPMPVTERISDCIIRLPLWVGLSTAQLDWICEQIYKGLQR